MCEQCAATNTALETKHRAELAAERAIRNRLLDERSRYILAAQRLYDAIELIGHEVAGYAAITAEGALLPTDAIGALQTHIQLTLNRPLPAPQPDDRTARLEALERAAETITENEDNDNGHCRYCGVEEKPVNADGEVIPDWDSEAIPNGWRFFHESWCPSAIIDAARNALRDSKEVR